MSAPVFERVSIPDEVPPDFMEQESTDLACEVCGTPLVYSGRGRKPKRCDEHKTNRSSSSGTTAKSNRDVESALATLDGIYNMVSMGLMMTQSEAAVMKWEQQRKPLQEQNRLILTADRDLCRRINDMTKKGGTGAFIVAQIMAFYPVALILKMELDARRVIRIAQANAKREADAAAAAGQAANDGTDFGPGAEYLN